MGTVIVSPGGSGSSFIIKEMNADSRPDVVFSPLDAHKRRIIPENLELCLSDLPTEWHATYFTGRTHMKYRLDLEISIEENMVRYLRKAVSSKDNVLLGGAISRVGPFFLRNKDRWPKETVVCFIRHPLQSMASFLLHRHPEKIDRYGRFSSSSCLIQYAMLWKKIVNDAIRGGLTIVRFEYAKEDSLKLKDERLKAVFADWIEGKRNYEMLTKDQENYFKKLVSNIYFQIYERWDV